MSITAHVKSVQNIKRQNAGVDGDAQRIVAQGDQLMWLCDALEAGLARMETQRRKLAAAVLAATAGSSQAGTTSAAPWYASWMSAT